ncbi:uncharacterized protein JN550_007572 [Neoarthrinium moseri]|uniref:uncharacterized protein n=1 Tax=Neoarthrinium moseri TaxID=1658444 RepID=UPI001FDDEF05|nr:uncharacterized protein JN550_007572 [Neoarthrinium moseri]KAI1866719.1 hypothetical protein JN550_007572 [Neoarthrinium moseri]
MRLLGIATFLVGLAFGQAQHVLQVDRGSSLVQPVYRPLSLGSTSPLGWLRDQLELEANGLAGNMFDFYRFVHNSKWIGGTTEYSILDEASPYWFNGLVPLAFGLNDTRIKGQVQYYLDYVLDHQQDDGWLGFETTHQTRGLWARCLLLLGLMQYAEADSTQTERIVDSMHRYVELAHSMLRDNYTGLLVHGDDVFDTAGFGVGRTHEYHIPLQWLYEKYPRNNSELIWETMELMIEGGVLWGADWRTFFVDGVYPTVYQDGVTPWNLSWVFLHGVNYAEGLRYPLAVYRMTHDEKLKEQTRFATDLLAKYHKSLAGTIIADEYISDLNPNRGAELCIAAEMIFSMTWIYQYLADNDLADWVELVAFNALPASISSDWYSHQYVQQENQPWSRNLTEGSAMWTDVNSYSNVFGLEPNYPCCTVNHPQGYPKFLANSFVSTEDGGLAHVYLSPGTVSTMLEGDNSVTISATGTYPFGLNLSYQVLASSPFSFYVRIPTWASNASKITGPGESSSQPITPSSKGLQEVKIAAGESTFTVELDTQPRVEMRANNTAGVYYGALLYSLAIEYNDTETPARQYNTQAVLPTNTTDSHSHDHIMVPTSLWNIAIDPSQIEVVQKNVSTIPNPVWSLGAPPVELRIAAIEIEWPLLYDSPDIPPLNPVTKGKPFSARFVPYASAKLHMAHLPVLSLPEVDLLEDKISE